MVPALHQNLEDAGLTRKILHKIAAECVEVLRTEWKTNIVQNFSGMGDKFVFAAAPSVTYSIVDPPPDLTIPHC
jgi:hypothetical protein